ALLLDGRDGTVRALAGAVPRPPLALSAQLRLPRLVGLADRPVHQGQAETRGAAGLPGGAAREPCAPQPWQVASVSLHRGGSRACRVDDDRPGRCGRHGVAESPDTSCLTDLVPARRRGRGYG